MKDKKTQVTEQLGRIMEQIEAAKEHWLIDDEKCCLMLLQAASREMKKVAWRIAPVLEDEDEDE
ncbi:FMN-dependent NADH-azoreductase [Rodentibacter trehalosifermentans]|uniref:FMN-dependent NADH-azoreductase n=1 Tax=Rodentibacter trehalosifermentans TaxID=1908263 RepID=A0A1V3IPY1_9PAST|nr:FMN-dependent NADH-azoreductase [Rodentibacter trehalosifermentans]OOF43959.1 FMN-dependent NADH-azoreductase [Rodentibacter trehalosifermentans]